MGKKFLLILGGPGAGKGTQCENIKKRSDKYVHLSTGDLLRAEIKAQSEIGKKVESIIANGQLVSDDIIVAMVNSFVNKTDKEVIVLDGFPRTVSQLKALLAIKDEATPMLIINLAIPDDELVRRIMHRGQTSGRADDNEVAAKQRLAVYHQQHDEMIAEVQKLNYHIVNNLGTIADVWKDVEAILDKEGF